MNRKTKKKEFEPNFESLSDVLTCSVGVMLFVVIFAVIETRGIHIAISAPIEEEVEKGTISKTFICKDGRIKFYDNTSAITAAIGNFTFNYQNIPKIVDQGNQLNISDGYYNYSFDFIEPRLDDFYSYRALQYIVSERRYVLGESSEELLQDSSKIASLIKEISKEKYWILFGLADGESLEVFKTARKIAREQKIPTGWLPGEWKFPRTITLDGTGIIVGPQQNN
ncbi:MAG: hypothetical protein R2824_29670 [Saprospiraceae bacterium]